MIDCRHYLHRWTVFAAAGLALFLAGCLPLTPTPPAAPTAGTQAADAGATSVLATATALVVTAVVPGPAATTRAAETGTPSAGEGPAPVVSGSVAYVRGDQAWIMSLPEGTAKRLPERDLRSPSWSPSGRFLLTGALLGSLRSQSPINVVTAAGVLVRGYNTLELPSDAFWAPTDPFRVAVATASESLTATTTARPGVKPTIALTPTLPVIPATATASTGTPSPAEYDWLAYMTRNGALRADSFPTGQSREVLPSGSLPSGGQGVVVWSDDGLLAWSENSDRFLQSGPAAQVLYVRAAGSSAAPRAWTLGDEAQPEFYQLLEFAPGTHLILASHGVATRAAPMPLVIIDADTGSIADLNLAARLTPESHAWNPVDHNLLAVASGGGQYMFDAARLAVINVSSGITQTLTPENMSVFEPAWSPDGKLLAYTSQPVPKVVSGNALEAALNGRAIYILDVSSGAARQLTEPSVAADGWPHWLPKGEGLLYARRSGGQTEVRVIGLDGRGDRGLLDRLPDRVCATQGCRWDEILAYRP